MQQFQCDVQDGYPADAVAVVDRGLDEFNHQAAPLHEVRPISCFLRDGQGQVVGGAIGRWWGTLCELQQLWVDARYRGRGLGARLVGEFERHAIAKGCTSFYLETLSFQAPGFYERLGYRIAFTRAQYPHGIAKHHMLKDVGGTGPGTRTPAPAPGPTV